MFPEPLPTKSSTLMKSEIRIDLVSDTATRPTEAMREAMAKAPVGDESRGEDPSVNALCRRVAELTGKDAAIFLPSGTMCNQIAILVHCRHGDEILTATDSHIVNSEGAGAAALAGAFIRELPSVRGMFDPDALREAVQPKTYARAPRTSLVTVEQTHNAGGGSIWPLAKLQAIRETARGEGLKMHMDGARLLNAVVASGTTARAFADEVDSVWIDFSKGLGCPIGAALAGQPRLHQGSLDLEAAPRWRYAASGHHGCGGTLRARSPCGAACRGPRQCAAFGRSAARHPRYRHRLDAGGDESALFHPDGRRCGTTRPQNCSPRAFASAWKVLPRCARSRISISAAPTSWKQPKYPRGDGRC